MLKVEFQTVRRLGVASSMLCLRRGFITFKTLTNVARRPLNTFSGSSASFSTEESKMLYK